MTRNPEERQMNIWIPRYLHEKIRQDAFDRRISMNEIFMELLRQKYKIESKD